MQFHFRGTRAEMVEAIEGTAAQQGRDIYVDLKSPDRIEIGFERHGHSGGRFFYAAITEENGVLTLTGEAEDSYTHKMSPARNRWDAAMIWLECYLVLFLLACVVLIFIDDLIHFTIPLWLPPVFPLPFLAIRIPFSRKEQRMADEDFFVFLAQALASGTQA